MLVGVRTPLVVENWERLMAGHPDSRFRDYILRGLKNGFRIGYNGADMVTSAKRNMLSTREHPEVVAEYLRKELERGVVLGPFHRDEVQGVVLNRFGVIPKSGQKRRWRLIVYLFYPEGKSVNDGIDPGLCSLKYVRVDDVVRRLLQLGPGGRWLRLM